MTKKPSPFNFSIDEHGNRIPNTPGHVLKRGNEILNDGHVMMAISEDPKTGEIAVHVMGPPTTKLIDTLEKTLTAFKLALASLS